MVENLVAPPERRVRLEIEEDSISSFFAYDLFSFSEEEKQGVKEEEAEEEKASKHDYKDMTSQVQKKLTRTNAVEFFWLAVSTKNEELLRLSY